MLGEAAGVNGPGEAATSTGVTDIRGELLETGFAVGLGVTALLAGVADGIMLICSTVAGIAAGLPDALDTTGTEVATELSDMTGTDEWISLAGLRRDAFNEPESLRQPVSNKPKTNIQVTTTVFFTKLASF